MVIVCIVFTAFHSITFYQSRYFYAEEFSTYGKQAPVTWLKIIQHN